MSGLLFDPKSIGGFTPGGFTSNMGSGVNPASNYIKSANASGGFYDSPLGAPEIPDALGKTGMSGFGMNMDTAKLGLGGLQTIGNIWNAWQAQKLAKEQFNFQKQVTETNLANQIKSYNTTLADRSRSRAFTEGGTEAESQAYIDKNQLSR